MPDSARLSAEPRPSNGRRLPDPALGGGRSPYVTDVAGGQFHAALAGADDEPPVPVDRLGAALQRGAVRQRHRDVGADGAAPGEVVRRQARGDRVAEVLDPAEVAP